MSKTAQIEWLGTMSIDDVSETLGRLANGQDQLNKMVSKLFERSEKRDKENSDFYREFRDHAAHEEKEFARTNAEVKALEDRIKAAEEERQFWVDMRKKLAIAGGVLVLGSFLTWLGKAMWEALKAGLHAGG